MVVVTTFVAGRTARTKNARLVKRDDLIRTRRRATQVHSDGPGGKRRFKHTQRETSIELAPNFRFNALSVRAKLEAASNAAQGRSSQIQSHCLRRLTITSYKICYVNYKLW